MRGEQNPALNVFRIRHIQVLIVVSLFRRNLQCTRASHVACSTRTVRAISVFYCSKPNFTFLGTKNGLELQEQAKARRDAYSPIAVTISGHLSQEERRALLMAKAKSFI